MRCAVHYCEVWELRWKDYLEYSFTADCRVSYSVPLDFTSALLRTPYTESASTPVLKTHTPH